MRKLFIAICLILLFAAVTIAAEVDLSWDAPGDARVVAYNAYFGETNPPTTAIPVGAATSVRITDLVIGTTYYFGATSLTATGDESAMSDILEYTIQEASQTIYVPPKPRQIRLIFEE